MPLRSALTYHPFLSEVIQISVAWMFPDPVLVYKELQIYLSAMTIFRIQNVKGAVLRWVPV